MKLKTDTETTCPIVCLDFIDAFGDRHTTFNLIEKGIGKAVGIIWMHNGIETRVVIVDRLASMRNDFVNDAYQLLENSTPQTFN
jgi:hypothetical protein